MASFVTCSFNPPSTNQLTTSITMTVSPSATGALTPPAGPWQKMIPVFAAMLLPVGGLVHMAGGKRRKKLLGLLLLVLVLLVMVGLPACGGNASHGTQPGTFTMTVTAASATTGDSGNTSITLNVI